MNKIIITILLALAFLIGPQIRATYAQESGQKQSAKEESVRKMIEAQDYVFKAQFVLPSRGRSRQLTSEYDLSVTKSKIEAYLPFFGRAYTAPLNPAEGGIKFSSSDFDYKVKEKKKGGWEIVMKPEDTREVTKMYLSVSTSGYASLRIISNNRDAISFNGYVQNRSN